MHGEKSHPIIYIALLDICLLVAMTLPWFQIATSQHRDAIVTKKEVLRISPMNNEKKEILQINGKRQIILKETKEAVSDYFVSGIGTSTPKKLLFSCALDRNPVVRFSQDGRWVEYATVDNGKWILGFYEMTSGKSIIVRDQKKDIVSGSKSSRDGRILYQAREQGYMPRVYLANPDGSSPRFIADGMGESWAPNGKWFLILKPEPDKMAPPRKIKGIPVKNWKWRYWVYSGEGSPIFEVSDSSHPMMHSWSPSSDKLLLTVYGELGFSIVSLSFSTDQVKGFQLEKLSDQGDRIVEYQSPAWSRDGKLFAFVKAYLTKSGDNYSRNEIWVSTSDGRQQVKLYEVSGLQNAVPFWADNGKILSLQKRTEPDHLSCVVELTIENMNQLFR